MDALRSSERKTTPVLGASRALDGVLSPALLRPDRYQATHRVSRKTAGDALVPTPNALSPERRRKLVADLAAARGHAENVWRDRAALVAGTVIAVVEIPKNDREKVEFDVRTGEFALDRIIRPEVGGYPATYGFIPQSFYHDGDPIDVLILGSSAPRGATVATRIVGIMYAADQKGLDSKLIAVPADSELRDLGEIPAAERAAIQSFFERYKSDDTGTSLNRILGWAGAGEANRELHKALRFYDEGVGASATRPRSTTR